MNGIGRMNYGEMKQILHVDGLDPRYTLLGLVSHVGDALSTIVYVAVIFNFVIYRLDTTSTIIIISTIMSATDIVKDPDLRSVLEAAEHAQHQCNVMLNFLDEHSSSRQSFSSSSTTSDGISPKEIEAAFTKYQKVLFARLSQVRGLNRNAIMGVRQTKQATAEARQEIDTLHLRLQNLYYEQHHLKGEIAACEGYEYVPICNR